MEIQRRFRSRLFLMFRRFRRVFGFEECAISCNSFCRRVFETNNGMMAQANRRAGPETRLASGIIISDGDRPRPTRHGSHWRSPLFSLPIEPLEFLHYTGTGRSCHAVSRHGGLTCPIP